MSKTADHVELAVIEMLRHGAKLKTCAEVVQISISTVWDIKNRAGLPKRNRVITHRIVNRVLFELEHYRGDTYKAIAERNDIHATQVFHIARKHGFPSRYKTGIDKSGISRQRIWQLKQRALGNCIQCGKPAQGKVLCESCKPKSRGPMTLAEIQAGMRARQLRHQDSDASA